MKRVDLNLIEAMWKAHQEMRGVVGADCIDLCIGHVLRLVARVRELEKKLVEDNETPEVGTLCSKCGK